MLPIASTVATFTLVPLVAWRIYVRFRRASGRQRLSRYRGPITLTIYVSIIVSVVVANLYHPLHVLAFAVALAVGGSLAEYALKRTQFEPMSTGLFYTPHGPVGISLAILFVVRLAYRLLEVYAIDPTTPRSLGEFARTPLTLGSFGLMAGYYAWYMLGLVRWRRRVIRAKREREARKGDA